MKNIKSSGISAYSHVFPTFNHHKYSKINFIFFLLFLLVASLIRPAHSKAASDSDALFHSAVNYPVDIEPYSLTTGDFNGDERLDLAVANKNRDNVSVLIGNGDGSFQTPMNYDVGVEPVSVDVGDFNGDGRLDLAVANKNRDNVSVLIGNGDGSFQKAVDYDVGIEPLSVDSGDFNGDGRLDLAVANKAIDNVSVLIGKGDGTFQTAVNYNVSVEPISIDSGDFNGDGRLDLAVANKGRDNVSVLMGNGDGTFGTAVNYAVGIEPSSLTTGDFNGDGRLDLVVANRARDNVSLLIGNGDGTFGIAVDYVVGVAPSSVVSGHFNGDRQLDITVANMERDNVSVLLGNGDGTFQAAVDHAVGIEPSCVSTGDFNGDGQLDLAVANKALNNVSILLAVTDTDDAHENLVYYPHIASDGNWETEIAIVNTNSGQTLSGRLTAYKNSGQEVDSQSITLTPNARRQIIIGNVLSNPGDIGYAIFESDSKSVSGYTKFYIEGTYRAAIPATSDVNTGITYISHIASDLDWTTGINILNTTSSPKDVSIKFDNGTTKIRTIAGYEHQAFTIRELFDGEMQSEIYSGEIKNGSGIVGLEVFGSTESSGTRFLTGILLKDDAATNIYYPHIASDSTWDTGIVAYNPSTLSCNLNISPFKEDGTALTSQTITLDGKEKYDGTIQDLNLPDGTAWFSILASSPITGFELFTTKDGHQMGGYMVVGINRANGVFAKIEKDGDTGIAFVNIENASSTVTITAFGDSGNAITTEILNLSPYEKVVDVPSNLFSQDISLATYIAYSSNMEVVGFQLNISSGGMMLDALPGM